MTSAVEPTKAKCQLRVVFFFVFQDFQTGYQKLGISVLTNFNARNYVLLNQLNIDFEKQIESFKKQNCFLR